MKKVLASLILLTLLACERQRTVQIMTAKEASQFVLEGCLKRIGEDFVQSGKNQRFGMTLCAFEGGRVYTDQGGQFTVSKDMMREVVPQLQALGFPAAISEGGWEDDAVSVCWGKNLKDWTKRYCRFVD